MTGGIVVVLGKTGRNFAAGMSGGVAYVLDEAGDFPKLCNMAMVELEPVLSEEMINENTYHQAGDLEAHGRVDVFANLLSSDIERLHILITRHAKLTGSRRAAEILANWKTWLPKFRKVMPVEYRRALKEMKANEYLRDQIVEGGVRSDSLEEKTLIAIKVYATKELDVPPDWTKPKISAAQRAHGRAVQNLIRQMEGVQAVVKAKTTHIACWKKELLPTQTRKIRVSA